MNRHETLKRLYDAHEIVADICERADRLYSSATSASPSLDGMPKRPNPQRMENIIVAMADLRALAETLLRRRARFDIFLCSLDPLYGKILAMRCRDGMRWKEVARGLRVSENTAREMFRRAMDAAAESGLFD